MKIFKTHLKRITALFVMAILLMSSLGLQNAYAQDTYIPALMNIEAELLDFTISNSVTFSGKQGETELSITPIVVTNNSSEKFINVKSIKYVNTLSDLSLKSSDTDFTQEGNSYSLIMDGFHDFSTADFIEDRPVMIGGGSQTFTFTGNIGARSSAYSNAECGNFVVTIEGTTEPIYNGFPVTELANISWSSGTDKQIAAIMDAAYSGIIDPSDYCGWKVGDERPIKLSSFRTVYNSANNTQTGQTAPACDATLVIYNKGGEILENGQECKYVIGFKECLANDQWFVGTKYYNFRVGDALNDYNNSFGDRDCDEIYKAMPNDIQSIFKKWKVYVSGPTTILKATTDGVSWITDNSTIQCLERYLALPALNNIYSVEEQDSQITRGVEDEYIKTKYEYFNNPANIVKKLVTKNTDDLYWLRSPNSCYKRGDFFTAYSIDPQGIVSRYASIDGPSGISPVGCI